MSSLFLIGAKLPILLELLLVFWRDFPLLSIHARKCCALRIPPIQCMTLAIRDDFFPDFDPNSQSDFVNYKEFLSIHRN